MKNVLWVSRHEMTESQLCDLVRVMGDAVRLLPVELLAGLMRLAGDKTDKIDCWYPDIPERCVGREVRRIREKGRLPRSRQGFPHQSAHQGSGLLRAGHLQRPGFHRGRGPADAEQSGRYPEVRSIPA